MKAKALFLHLLFLCLFAATLLIAHWSGSRAAVLGSFEHVQNSPGSIVAPGHKQHQSPYKNKRDGIDRRSPSQILFDDYLTPEGFIRTPPLQQHIHELQQWQRNSFVAYCTTYSHARNISTLNCPYRFQKQSDPAYKKWSQKKLSQTAQLLVHEFERAITLAQGLHTEDFNSPVAQQFLSTLFQALELKAALGSESTDTQRSFLSDLKLLKNMHSSIRIPAPGAREALNLHKPMQSPKTSAAPSVFYGPRDLLQHPDPSLLDPLPSGFWRPQNITQFKTHNYNGLLKKSLGAEAYAQVSKIEDPDALINLYFDSPGGGGLTPKLNALFNGFRFKVKLTTQLQNTPDKSSSTESGFSRLVAEFYRHSGEVRSEFVANSLAAALGFTVAPTFYKKQARLFFNTDNFDPKLANTPKGHNELRHRFLQARDQVAQQLARQKHPVLEEKLYAWDYLAALENIGVVNYGPDRGRYFVQLQSISLEFQRIKKQLPGLVADWRVGLFNKHTLGKYLKREFRAFMLFYIWLADKDTKNANASVGFVRPPQQGLKVFYSADDMGATLGNAFAKNKPNFFHYDMLRPLPDGRGIEFHTWKSFYLSPLFKHITLADAKWMARLMAQLSHQQIKTIFLTAHYPEVVAELYTQKLLRRRDQLVQALGLHGTTTLSLSGQQVPVRADTSAIDEPARYAAPSCPKCFQNGELVQLPEGVKSDENWTLSLRSLPNNPVRSEAKRKGKKMLFNFFSRIVGRYANMYTLGADWSLGQVTGSVGTLVPARYIVQNPFGTAQTPFWVVDIYRLVARAGQNNIWNKFNFWPDKDRWRYFGRKPQISANMIEIFEFVRVRPVGSQQKAYSLADVVKIYHPKKIIGTHLGELKRQLVEGLDEGDFLISSRYLMFRPGFRLRSYLWHPSFEIDVVPLVVNTKRIALYQQAHNKLLMHWSKGHKRSLHLGLDFEMLAFELPIIEKRSSYSKQLQRTYAFNPQVPEEKKLVLKYINRDLPKNIDQQYALNTLKLTQKQNFLKTSFFGLKTNNKFQKLTSAQLRSSDEKLLKSWASSYKGSRFKILSLKNFKVNNLLGVVSFVDHLTGRLMVRVDLSFKKKHALKKDYTRVREALRGLMPWRFLQFDSNSVNYYLGQLEAEAKVLFSNQAVVSLFEPRRNKMQICQAFAHYTRVVEVTDKSPQVNSFCTQVLANNLNALLTLWQSRRASDRLPLRDTLVAVKKFIFYFLKAQKKYHRFKAAWDVYDQDKSADGARQMRQQSHQLVSALTDLFRVTPAPGASHLALLSMVPPGSLWREVSWYSSAEAFPGQLKKLNFINHHNNKAKWLGRQELEATDAHQFVATALSPAFRVLAPFFADNAWKAFIDSTPTGRDVLNTLTPGVRQVFYTP